MSETTNIYTFVVSDFFLKNHRLKACLFLCGEFCIFLYLDLCPLASLRVLQFPSPCTCRYCQGAQEKGQSQLRNSTTFQ